MTKDLFPLARRLEFIAAGRKLHTWAKAIGLPKISIENVMKGNGLSGDTLQHLHRVENVRTDWLLEGRGNPFSVNCCLSDDGAAEILTDLLAEKWEVDILTDDSRIAVILSQPAQVQVKDGKDESGAQRYRDINYRVVEIVCGVFGRRAMGKITDYGFNEVLLVPANVLGDLEKGRVGSYVLFTSPSAVVAQAAEHPRPNVVLDSIARGDLAPSNADEKALLGYYRAMAPEQRKAINQVAVSMAASEGLQLKGQ